MPDIPHPATPGKRPRTIEARFAKETLPRSVHSGSGRQSMLIASVTGLDATGVPPGG